MQALGPAAFGFVVASVLTFFELITSKYPRTHVFLWKSWALYAYCAIYGVIALVVLLCFDRLAAAGVVRADGLGLGQPWIRALEIGIAVKALLHIRLFTVTTGSQTFPVGLESFVQIFEPWLLDHLAQDEFNNVSTYITEKRQKHGAQSDAAIKTVLKNNIRTSLPPAEKAAIAIDIDQARNGEEAMTVYLSRFGKMSLCRLFP